MQNGGLVGAMGSAVSMVVLGMVGNLMVGSQGMTDGNQLYETSHKIGRVQWHVNIAAS